MKGMILKIDEIKEYLITYGDITLEMLMDILEKENRAKERRI